jgi:hypothetical protein
MHGTVRNAFIGGDLHTVEDLLTQEIDADDNNHNSYVNRSIVKARNSEWDNALQDAVKVKCSAYHDVCGVDSTWRHSPLPFDPRYQATFLRVLPSVANSGFGMQWRLLILLSYFRIAIQ